MFTINQSQINSLSDVLKGPVNRNTGLPNGQFTKLIELQGESIWEDESNMNNDTQWLGPLQPGEEGYEKYKDQYNEMLDYLANKSIMDNVKQNNIEIVGDDNQNVGQADRSGPKKMQVDEEVKVDNGQLAKDLIIKYSSDPQTFNKVNE